MYSQDSGRFQCWRGSWHLYQHHVGCLWHYGVGRGGRSGRYCQYRSPLGLGTDLHEIDFALDGERQQYGDFPLFYFQSYWGRRPLRSGVYRQRDDCNSRRNGNRAAGRRCLRHRINGHRIGSDRLVGRKSGSRRKLYFRRNGNGPHPGSGDLYQHHQHLERQRYYSGCGRV
ncbi:hypothetical protein TG4357_01677 [Thalassovita gelatinovora]|uniref:Uncharacterized protein n=1 Tax=Thalassovita gelatinovora TaxID=53501 RepID=A0A0P1FAJ3_THAGE|nr:hypothetical protein TG4357_01677 [Thalassovita gelatinovora]